MSKSMVSKADIIINKLYSFVESQTRSLDKYIKLSMDARKVILKQKPASFGDCSPVSVELGNRLKTEFDDVTLVSGNFIGKTEIPLKINPRTSNHTWIEIPSQNLYIDATFDQFGFSDDKIRIGNLTDSSFKRDYDPKERETEFEHDY